MFLGIDKKTMLRRLRLLHLRKVLSRFVSFKGGEIVWAIHPEYARKVALDFMIKSINRQNLLYDLLVNDVRLSMEQLGVSFHWNDKWWSSHYIGRTPTFNNSIILREVDKRQVQCLTGDAGTAPF